MRINSPTTMRIVMAPDVAPDTHNTTRRATEDATNIATYVATDASVWRALRSILEEDV